jgi:hypothetical protein
MKRKSQGIFASDSVKLRDMHARISKSVIKAWMGATQTMQTEEAKNLSRVLCEEFFTRLSQFALDVGKYNNLRMMGHVFKDIQQKAKVNAPKAPSRLRVRQIS